MMRYVNKNGKRIIPKRIYTKLNGNSNNSFNTIENPIVTFINNDRKCTVDKLVFCTVHFNTPLLTECLIKSINKFNPNSEIYVFDNSDKEPFVNKFENVKVIDNTKGQIINFEEWLNNYPNKKNSNGKFNQWGSAKHCYTIQKCIELINKNFILLDSDILFKKDVSEIWDENMIYVGNVKEQPNSTIKRVLPFICFINVNMCKEKNISYFNDNYMHGLHKTIMSDRYDTGAYFYLTTKDLPHNNIKYEDYATHYKGGSWFETHNKRYNRPLKPNEWLEQNKNLWDKNNKVIYTCITGNYDALKEPKVITPEFDYICFTDNLEIKSNVWQIRPLPNEVNGLDNVRKQRYVKLNPHKVLTEYDISLWVDGSIIIKDNVNTLMGDISNYDILIPQHPKRNCIYSEANECIRMKKDNKETIEKQMDEYKNEGFPKMYGLPQSNIMIRKHNTEYCKTLMEMWWNEVKNKSRRDQLSFNYCLWKLGENKIKYLDKKIYDSKYFFWVSKHQK